VNDRDAGEEFVWIGARRFEDIVVADEKVRVGLIEPAVVVVDPVHAEEYSFLDMAGGAQFGEQIVEVFPVRFPWVRRRQLVFPQEEAKQRASQHLWRNVAAVVAVRQRGQVNMAVDQGFAGHHAPLIIGDISLL
jgi:hypothetical protein